MKKKEVEFTIPQVAVKLGMSAYDVFCLIHAGELKAYRFGGHFRVTPDQLNAYIEKLEMENNRED